MAMWGGGYGGRGWRRGFRRGFRQGYWAGRMGPMGPYPPFRPWRPRPMMGCALPLMLMLLVGGLMVTAPFLWFARW